MAARLPTTREGALASALYEDLRTPALAAGDPALPFELSRLDVGSSGAAGTVELRDLLGERPLALVFGSYTCPRFREDFPAVDALWRAVGERVAFAVVYIREAHPADGWQSERNVRDGLLLPDPTDLEGRLRAARSCAAALDIRMPVLVDGLEDRVASAYGAWPSRSYLIDPSGRVLFQGRPMRVDAPGLERAIRGLLRWRWLSR